MSLDHHTKRDHCTKKIAFCWKDRFAGYKLPKLYSFSLRPHHNAACETNSDLSLAAGNHSNLEVAPRWPYTKVVICREAFSRLEQAQQKMEPSVQLVITRGFEPGNWIVRRLHLLMRKIGSIVFLLLYPRRASEIPEIFSPNGHDTDGTHVDVSIRSNGRLLNFLPMGVLTPTSHIAASEAAHSDTLSLVKSALTAVGFRVHTNQTEALQIHCDLAL